MQAAIGQQWSDIAGKVNCRSLSRKWLRKKSLT
jgi:hypothetical protein